MSVLDGAGTVISYGNLYPNPTSYTPFAQVLSTKPPGGEVEPIETWNLSSKVKTYRPGLITEPGDVTFRVQWDPNDPTHVLLESWVVTPAIQQFQVVYNDDKTNTHATDTFTGFVTKFEPSDLEGNKNNEADITIKISGQIQRTQGS